MMPEQTGRMPSDQTLFDAADVMSETRKRVLVVDDDEQVLESVQLALQDRGYEVMLARDGSEALVRAERDEPDLIILDVVMPKRSGFVVLDRIRKSHVRSPRIIMVTANDAPRQREFAESRGIDAFVSKPFDMCSLLNKVDSLMKV